MCATSGGGTLNTKLERAALRHRTPCSWSSRFPSCLLAGSA
jgi:hypothetical protein